MPRPPADPTRLAPTSAVLQQLHDEVPADHFTLGWLMHSLRKRSFGIIMLLLALVAIVPGLSIVAGLLLMIPGVPDDRGQTCSGLPTPHRHSFLADEAPRCCGAAIPTGAQIS
jgi:Exopolysaccharide synthesis, ExoD